LPSFHTRPRLSGVNTALQWKHGCREAVQCSQSHVSLLLAGGCVHKQCVRRPIERRNAVVCITSNWRIACERTPPPPSESFSSLSSSLLKTQAISQNGPTKHKQSHATADCLWFYSTQSGWNDRMQGPSQHRSALSPFFAARKHSPQMTSFRSVRRCSRWAVTTSNLSERLWRIKSNLSRKAAEITSNWVRFACATYPGAPPRRASSVITSKPLRKDPKRTHWRNGSLLV